MKHGSNVGSAASPQRSTATRYGHSRFWKAAVRASAKQTLGKSMKSGALIVIESYGAEASTPNRPTTAIDPAELLAAFKDSRLFHFEDTVARANWSPPQTKTRIVRMVAEKRP
jgi:hypothetical protein